MVILSQENFGDEVPVLVDFYADWCAPCLMISPAVEEIAEQYEGKLKVCKLNVDEAPAIAAKYNIMSIPFLGIFKDGKLVSHIIEAVPKQMIEGKVRTVL
ncbi:MAG: thioredoxin [Elusimicrobia bacterium]|nr:thioredoxin [Elusimicrobiota bacterium]